MTEEAQVHKIALFYYFTTMDESEARQASVRAYQKTKKKIQKEGLGEASVAPAIVHSLHSVPLKSKSPFGWFRSRKVELGWLPAEGVDLGGWRSFLKEAEPDEREAVILSRILNFTDQDISIGLGVTEGTVRHRVGRGLRLLGECLSREEKSG